MTVYGFLNIMFKILEEEKADHLAVAFDLKEPTFRHKMYDAYKGTRKPMPEELREQVPLMKEVLASMNIPIMTLPGYEADDILGTRGEEKCQARWSGSICGIRMTGIYCSLRMLTLRSGFRRPAVVEQKSMITTRKM